MTLARLPVGVVVERRRARSPWAEWVWRPVAVLPAPAEAGEWTPLGEAEEAARFYAGAGEVALHRADTAMYRDNLATGRPMLWVRLRLDGAWPRLIAVTADPAEGEAFTEAGEDLVDQVAMPPEIAAAVAAFVAAHHVERVFIKRRRDDDDD